MNLTNLIDTAFTLLIAFMLVAPMLKHGIDMDLPQVSHENISTTGKPLIVAIGKPPAEGFDVPIYIEGQRVTLEELADAVKERLSTHPETSVVIEADKSVMWETLAKVLAVLKNNSVENLALITEPENFN